MRQKSGFPQTPFRESHKCYQDFSFYSTETALTRAKNNAPAWNDHRFQPSALFLSRVWGKPQEIIRSNMIKPAQRDQMANGQLVSAALIPGVHRLRGAQHVGHLLLGQTGVLPQITHVFAIVQAVSLPSFFAALIGQRVQRRQNILFLRFSQHSVTGNQALFPVIQSNTLFAFVRIDFKKFRH